MLVSLLIFGFHLKGENIMNEFELRDELIEKRKNIKNFDDLVEFLRHVKDNCNCGYGEAPRAMAQACLAVGWYLADVFGITGFQAGCVMWDFIRDWNYSKNESGLKIVDYDNMLYPQYRYHFEKTIKPSVWEALKKEAAKRLEDSKYAHPDVINHWKSIVAGNVPFGYSVKDS